MKLAIISHTEHYLDGNGGYSGWGPTVREINFLAAKFEEIYHIACLHEGRPPDSSLPYNSSNIKFIPIPPSGGNSILDKISVVSKAPEVLKKIDSVLDFVDAVQLRVPTGMANYILPYLTWKRKKMKPLIWVKYAGNWNQENAPSGYKFQKWWLENNYLNCKITINGKWPDQPDHCKSFENPCLDHSEREQGSIVINRKHYNGMLTACFIGRMESAKGVGRILESLPQFADKKITTIHFIGEGMENEKFKQLAANQSQVNCIFHGSMSRNLISDYLEMSHFLLLPSTASEGFPKVIAEGANYGAIPIVSDVSGITHYINQENGFVWKSDTSFALFVESLDLNPESLLKKSQNGYHTAASFTFENYYQKLKNEIFS